MRVHITLLVLLVLSGSEALKAPLHLWPLAFNSLTWDVQKGTLDSSTISGNCPLLSTDSKFGYSSFLFEGSGKSGSDLRVTPTNVFPKVTFSVFLSPDLLNGVFFEFRSDSGNDPSKLTVNRVVGELVEGRVRMTVWIENQADTTITTQSVSIGVWEHVMLTVNDKDQLVVHIGLQEHIGAMTQTGVDGTSVPGTWRLGQSWTGDSSFYGKINCAAFYDDDIKVSEIPGAETNDCPEPQWSRPPSGVPDCGDGSLPTPSQVWPLNNVTGGYEVLSGMAPLSEQGAISCLRTDDTQSDLLLPSLQFDGSKPSHIRLQADHSLLDDGDFAITIFVRAMLPPEGRIWEYSASGSTPGMSHIQVGFNPNNSLLTSLWMSGGGASPCGELTVPDAMKNSTWVALVVQREAVKKKLKVSVNGHEWDTTDTCTTGAFTAGEITLASSTEHGAGFRGSLACLTIFSSSLPSIPISQLTKMCQHFEHSTNTSITPCPGLNDLQHEAFRLVATLSQPGSPCPAPISSVRLISLIQCAGVCARTPYCRSFAFTRGMTSQPGCHLFDYVTKACLITSPSNYYEINTFE